MQNAIQSIPEKQRRWAQKEEDKNADPHLRAYGKNRRNYQKKEIRKRPHKKNNKVDPVVLVPTKLEEAPLRRMDRRALNALRKRRSDKHMICCLTFTAILLIAAGVGAVVLWRMFSEDMKHLGPLIILGPILLLSGVLVVVFMMEICVRLRKQIKRVMDPSLLKTSNFHEVKHWVEPELISFGWGQFDYQEEAKLLDEKHLRKKGHGRNHFVA